MSDAMASGQNCLWRLAEDMPHLPDPSKRRGFLGPIDASGQFSFCIDAIHLLNWPATTLFRSESLVRETISPQDKPKDQA
jgi:hypothetical protein